MSMSVPSSKVTKPAARDQAPGRRATIAAETLFQGERELEITFRGAVYRLRITRNDKLILTK